MVVAVTLGDYIRGGGQTHCRCAFIDDAVAVVDAAENLHILAVALAQLHRTFGY